MVTAASRRRGVRRRRRAHASGSAKTASTGLVCAWIEWRTRPRKFSGCLAGLHRHGEGGYPAEICGRGIDRADAVGGSPRTGQRDRAGEPRLRGEKQRVGGGCAACDGGAGRSVRSKREVDTRAREVRGLGAARCIVGQGERAEGCAAGLRREDDDELTGRRGAKRWAARRSGDDEPSCSVLCLRCAAAGRRCW